MAKEVLKPGYKTFIGSDPNTFLNAARDLDNQINDAMQTFDITFLGGHLKFDDNTAYRPMPLCLVSQSVLLKAKSG